jgi:hypothetical protein
MVSLNYRASIPRRPTAAPSPAPKVSFEAAPVSAGLSGVVDELPLGLRVTAALPVALIVDATTVLFLLPVGYGVTSTSLEEIEELSTTLELFTA